MPVFRKNIKKQPVPRSRFQWSPLYDTVEWKDTVQEIEKGLKPHEYVEVVLSPETIAEVPLKDPVSAMVVALRRFVRSKKLALDITTRAHEGDEQMHIYIQGRADRVA
jgi:hypothetical protein